jgi:hypothetical protein
MIVIAFLAAALSVTPPPFSLKQTPPPLNARQAERLKAIEPCLKWNAERAAYRKQQYRQTGRKAPQGQYAVIRRVGECSVSTPMR